MPFKHKGQIIKHPAEYLALVKESDIRGNIKALWDMPYEADPIAEPDFVGLTQGQVILFKQLQSAIRGDGAATDRLLDRLVGRPEQVNKNLNVSGTYAEWLDQLAKQDEIIDIESHPIE